MIAAIIIGILLLGSTVIALACCKIAGNCTKAETGLIAMPGKEANSGKQDG